MNACEAGALGMMHVLKRDLSEPCVESWICSWFTRHKAKAFHLFRLPRFHLLMLGRGRSLFNSDWRSSDGRSFQDLDTFRHQNPMLRRYSDDKGQRRSLGSS